MSFVTCWFRASLTSLYIPFLLPTQKVGGRLHVVGLTCGFSHISWTLRAWHAANLAVAKKVQHLRRSGQPRPWAPPNLHILNWNSKFVWKHCCSIYVRILVARQLASVGSGISVVDLGGPSVGVSWRQLGYRGTSKGLVLTYPASVGVS